MLLVRPRCTCLRLPPFRRISFGLTSGFKPVSEINELEKQIPQPDPEWTPPPPLSEEEKEAAKKRRRTEWKRRQGGETFLDHIIVHVRAGRGGDGCVSFHREKFQEYGPPSGGNGGNGSDVYILPTPHLTTLSSVSSRIRGQPGGSGKGTWMAGRNAPPTIIKVPLGTVVRELSRDDPRRIKDPYEVETESLEGLDLSERRDKLREARWVHYPSWHDKNVARSAFKDAERQLFREERELRLQQRMRRMTPIYLDLDKAEETVEAEDPNAPLGVRRAENLGHLIARGGRGGLGNPHFYAARNLSPKFATRGTEGEWVSLALELKLLADVGLVGKPNAGKSTLLRALTGGRARTAVAGYAFTTLNPVVAVVRVHADGSFQGHGAGRVYDDTAAEDAREHGRMERGAYAYAGTRNARRAPAEGEDEWDAELAHAPLEAFRFTIADNPGLIADAADDVGLGHSFLRAIERSPALAYVVDLAGAAPWDDLRVLREELEKYKPGMSPKARMVIANKADLLGGDGRDAAAVAEAREKLRRLEAYVREEMAVEVQNAAGVVVGRRLLDVVPVSAKFSMNLQKAVGLMREYVEEARGGAQLVEQPTGSEPIFEGGEALEEPAEQLPLPLDVIDVHAGAESESKTE